MKLIVSIEVLRKMFMLFTVSLALKPAAYAVEPSAANNGAGSAMKIDTSEKGFAYEAAAESEREKAEIERLSKRVAELNTKADRDGKRRAELQEVVDKGAPGAAQAISELQMLRKSPAIKERDEYIQELKTKQTEISKNLAATRAKLKNLQSDRSSRFSNKLVLDADERKFVGWIASLSSAERINNALLRRLESGWVGGYSSQPSTNEELQERFFPTR